MSFPSMAEALSSLDEQHDGLVADLETLSRQVFDSEQRATVAEGLRNLMLDIGMHFGFEEALMDEWQYPEAEHHRRQHLSLMTELGLMLDRFADATSAHSMARGIDFLTEWYSQHAVHSDEAFTRWLQAGSG